MATMKAAVIHEAGGPEVLKIESLLIPKPKSGEVLIRVKAFGLNRSELFTRQGHSPKYYDFMTVGTNGAHVTRGKTRRATTTKVIFRVNETTTPNASIR